MDPQRWGDPAAAADSPRAARGLIELAFGVGETPRRRRCGAAARALRRAARGLSGLARRRARAGRRRRPARLRTRGSRPPTCCGPGPGPVRRARRRRPAGLARRRRAVLAWAVEHHVAVVPFGGGTCVTGGLAARRDGFAGLVSLDLVRMKRLLAVDHESMTASSSRACAVPRPRRCSPPRVCCSATTRSPSSSPRSAASPPPGPPGSPVPATAGSTPSSSASGSRRRAASCGSGPRPRTPPAPTCASCSSAPRAPSASSPR